MAGLLALHISALLCWCGALLYLPALTVRRANEEGAEKDLTLSVARKVFTLFATPAALIAIISGTALFALSYTIAVWLILKLTLVSALVVCHVFAGQLIFHLERKLSRNHDRAIAGMISTLSALCIGGILWLVLAKPF